MSEYSYHGPSVEEAAYRVAHDFPAKVPGMARHLGLNAGTFGNQLNTNTETHALKLVTAVAMTLVSDDPRIIEAFAGTCGFGVFRLPEGITSDEALLDCVLNSAFEVGEFARRLREALQDGDISRKELREMDEQCRRVLGAYLTLLARVGALSRGR
jgi:hypothetical protein